MKKYILGGVAAVVIAVLAGVNVNMNSQSENLLSDLALANVEALAIELGSSGNWTVTILGTHSWRCTSGGSVCCPDFYSESC
ncbi:MAG: NVEALA domain-containing protein [Prevotellaceae bacterium]|jgi:hypothetical protein|nr:NVEALA domain-containing protein [Prevotellaceae bacterium]